MATGEKAKLWKRAHGLCSMRCCDRDLVFDGKVPKFGGQAAHIKGREPTAARYDKEQPANERDSYGNLILLCPNHHTDIDEEPEKYTVEKLHSIKNAHEKRMQQLRQQGIAWREDYMVIDYLNVPRLMAIPSGDPIANPELLESVQALSDHPLMTGNLMNAYRASIREWTVTATDLFNISPGEDVEGLTVFFDGRFVGRNMPNPGHTPVLTGDPEHDPHLSTSLDDRTAILRIDPRWITTSTAYGHLRGNRRKSGIGIVMHVDAEQVHVSPLVIGLRVKPGAGRFYD